MIHTTTKLIRHLVFLAILATAASTGASTIVYDNIAPSAPLYHPYGSWTGTHGNQYSISATSFLPSATGTLDLLDLGLTQGLGQNSVTLRLSPDVAGAPSLPIWQTSVPPAPGYGSLLNISNIGGPLLTAGQQYWLEALAPVTPATLHNWWMNNQGDIGPIISAGTPRTNLERFALRVGVLAVPEPSACAILAIALATALCWCRRR